MIGSARSVAEWPTPLRDDGVEAPAAAIVAATAGAVKARIR